jgi:hypothetical protein
MTVRSRQTAVRRAALPLYAVHSGMGLRLLGCAGDGMAMIKRSAIRT